MDSLRIREYFGFHLGLWKLWSQKKHNPETWPPRPFWVCFSFSVLMQEMTGQNAAPEALGVADGSA